MNGKKVAVVTGASSGIGRALAGRLAADGYRVVLIGRDAARLEAVAKEIQSAEGTCLVLGADLANLEETGRLSRTILDQAGSVDVLVHSAGAASIGEPIRKADGEVLDGQLRINVRAPYELTRALLDTLKARQGQVVFINSSVGLRSKANAAAYGMSKHALRALADSLREEVNADGIRVLTVVLGRTATPMQQEIFRTEHRAYHPERLLQPEDIASVVSNALSLPRTAEVTEVHIRPMMKSY